MARDPMTPGDPEYAEEPIVDPTKTLPVRSTDQGEVRPLGDYRFFMHQGLVPFRAKGGLSGSLEVFSREKDGWMHSNQADPYEMWEASPEEISAEIGNARRLTEPAKGVVPYVESDEPEEWEQEPAEIAEADSSADFPQPPDQDTAPESVPSGMNAAQIRKAGLQIDLPYEAVSPVYLRYKKGSAKTWTPPPGFRSGLAPIDPLVAERLGVPRELGSENEPTAQEGLDGSSTASSGESSAGPPRRVRRRPAGPSGRAASGDAQPEEGPGP